MNRSVTILAPGARVGRKSRKAKTFVFFFVLVLSEEATSLIGDGKWQTGLGINH